MRNHGFTLIEATIVVALITFIGTLSLLNTHAMHRMIARAEIEKLQTMCRYLQQCAITEQVEYSLRFDSATHSYTYGNVTESLPPYIVLGPLAHSYGPPAHPTQLLTNATTFTDNTILFYPTGIISSGTVYLRDKSGSIMYALTNAVAHASYLRTYYYDGAWHLMT
jgi:hypothetical protein